jgi:hypothetical protein
MHAKSKIHAAYYCENPERELPNAADSLPLSTTVFMLIDPVDQSTCLPDGMDSKLTMNPLKFYGT